MLSSPKYYFDELDKPIATLKSHEEMVVEVYDTYTNQITSEKILRPDIDYRKLTPITGPFYFEEAWPGNVLKVEIVDIEIDENGVMPLMPGMGLLGDKVNEISTRIFHLNNQFIPFTDKMNLPVRPMIGTIGIAPKGDRVRAYTPGDFGGNLDFNGIGIGSVIYFPVFVPGALLYLGDLHALQGDGELNGTGMEVSGKVKLRVSTSQVKGLVRPVVRSRGVTSFISSHRSIEKAIEIAVEDSINWLMNSFTLSRVDAYRLISLAGNIRICQIVNPRVTVRVDIEDSVINLESFFTK